MDNSQHTSTAHIPNPYQTPDYSGGRFDFSIVPKGMGTDLPNASTREELISTTEVENTLFRRPGLYDERNDALVPGRPTFDLETNGTMVWPLSFPYQRDDWRVDGSNENTRTRQTSEYACIDRQPEGFATKRA